MVSYSKRGKYLGSIISSQKYKYTKKKSEYTPSEQFQIHNVVKRLEQYQKYKKALHNEKLKKKNKVKREIISKLKKESYQKAYTNNKPVHNPYVELLRHHHIAPDPNLMKKYKATNIYSYYAFRYLKLPRSDYKIEAGQAWGALVKCWMGYRLSKHRLHNDEKTQQYASALQKWHHILELPVIPDFSQHGLPAEDFIKSKED